VIYNNFSTSEHQDSFDIPKPAIDSNMKSFWLVYKDLFHIV